MSHTDPRPRRRSVVVLSVAAVLLLAASAALGLITFRLLGERASGAQPAPPTTAPPSAAAPSPSSPAPDPTTTPLPETQPRLMSQGVPVLVRSDFTVRELALTRWEPDSYTRLIAPVFREDGATVSGTVHIDITAYDGDGNIIARSPTSFVWRPGQTVGLITLAMRADLPSAAQFVIEQTLFEEETFDLTGDVSVASVTVGDAFGLRALAEFSLASTLSGPVELAEVGVLGSIDGRLFAACVTRLNIPAGPAVADSCEWEPVSSEFVPEDLPAPPAGATYEATLSF